MLSGRCGATAPRLALLLLAFPLALKADPIHVTGRALMDRTRGLSGAHVEIFSAYEEYAEAAHRLARGGAPAPVATGQTDSKGFFDLAVPASGCFRLIVRTAGDLPMEYPLLPLAETTEVPPVLLESASPLEVRTVGIDGRPIPGAAVRVERPRWYGQDAVPRWQPANQDGVSGADGKVALLRNPEEPPEVISLSPRFLGQRTHVAGRETAVVLRLLPLPLARIEIQDAAGKPVAGALVRWQGQPVAVAGPEGRLEIAAPGGDSLDVESAAGQARLVPVPKPGIAVMPFRLEPPRRIAGKVLDALSGEPVKGSVIWSGRPPVAPAVVSGADGAFQLDVQPQEGTWVETAAPGFLPGERRFVPRGEAGPVLLKLTPSAAISGLVVDAADRPVAAAQVEIELRAPSSLVIRPVRTGSDGRFRLTGLLPGSRYDLSVTREGFARTSATARTPPAGGKSTPPLRIVMDGGATASGLSAGEDGQPLPGVELLLLDNRRGDAIRATSDENGRFELRHLPSGRYDLLADHPGYVRTRLESIDVPAGVPAVGLGTVTMQAATAIEGRVTDLQGRPIAEAEVRARTDLTHHLDVIPLDGGDMPRDNSVRTRAAGDFRVEGLRRGTPYNVTVTHAGYAAETAAEVKAPTREPVRIELKEARSLACQVVGLEGEPVAGARIDWIPDGQSFDEFPSLVRPLGMTDGDGRLQATGLPPVSLTLSAEAVGYRSRRLPGLRIPEDHDPPDVKIVLERLALLDIRVLSVQGEPVEGISVSASLQGNRPHQPDPSEHYISPCTTNADGRCGLTADPGAYAVTGVGKSQSARELVVAGPGRTSVELRLPAGGTEVSGRVVEEDGTGVPGALVVLERPESRRMSTQTQGDGSFRLSGLPDGTYEVRVYDVFTKRISEKSLEITVAGLPVRNLELRLPARREGAQVTGHILGLAPEELSQVGLTASIRTAFPLQGQVARDGSYRVDGLSAGEWSIYASLPSGRRVEGFVQIAPAAPATTLDLEFPAVVMIRGHVLVDGAPLAGAAIQLSGKQDYREDRTAYDGSFTLRDVPLGEVYLRIAGPGGIGGSRNLQISESLDSAIEEDLAIELATGRLRGKVVSDTGAPVEDAIVEATLLTPEFQDQISSLRARSGEEGVFKMPRLAAGTFRIVAEKQGFAQVQTRVEVQPGQETTVELVLAPKNPG